MRGTLENRREKLEILLYRRIGVNLVNKTETLENSSGMLEIRMPGRMENKMARSV